MIDFEKEIYTKVINAVTASFPDIRTYSDSLPEKPQFPCLILEQADNYVYDLTQDSKSLENHAIAMFELSVYSNKATDKKDECKTILKVADDEMRRLGFTRTSALPVAIKNSTIYRIVARYSGCISANGDVSRR